MTASSDHYCDVALFGAIGDLRGIAYISSLASNFRMMKTAGHGVERGDDDEFAGARSQGLQGFAQGVQHALGPWLYGAPGESLFPSVNRVSPVFLAEAFLAAGIIGPTVTGDHHGDVGADRAPEDAAPFPGLPTISPVTVNVLQDTIDMLSGHAPVRASITHWTIDADLSTDHQIAHSKDGELTGQLAEDVKRYGIHEMKILIPGTRAQSELFFQQLSAAFPGVSIRLSDYQHDGFSDGPFSNVAFGAGKVLATKRVSVTSRFEIDGEDGIDGARAGELKFYAPEDRRLDLQYDHLDGPEDERYCPEAAAEAAETQRILDAHEAAGRVEMRDAINSAELMVTLTSIEYAIEKAKVSEMVSGKVPDLLAIGRLPSASMPASVSLSRGPGEIFNDLDRLLVGAGTLPDSNYGVFDFVGCRKLLAACSAHEAKDLVALLSSPDATLANRTHFVAQAATYLSASDFDSMGSAKTPEGLGFENLVMAMRTALEASSLLARDVADFRVAIRGHGELLPEHRDDHATGWEKRRFHTALNALPVYGRENFTRIHLAMAMLTLPSVAAWELAIRQGVDKEFLTNSALECPHRAGVLANVLGTKVIPSRAGVALNSIEGASQDADAQREAEIAPVIVPGTLAAREAVIEVVETIKRSEEMRVAIRASKGKTLRCEATQELGSTIAIAKRRKSLRL